MWHEAERFKPVWGYQMLLRSVPSLLSIPDIQHGGDKQSGLLRSISSCTGGPLADKFSSYLSLLAKQRAHGVPARTNQNPHSCSDSAAVGSLGWNRTLGGQRV